MENIDTRDIFEKEILKKIINDSSYFGSVVPYLKPDYFQEPGNNTVFKNIFDYYADTGKKPNTKDLILLIKDENKNEKIVAAGALKQILNSKDTSASEQLLISKTEQFIRKAIHTEALIIGAEGMGENDPEKLKKSFEIAEEAQKVSLNEDFGVNINQVSEAIEYYQDQTMGLLTGITSFDKMLGKGYREKQLHMFLAAPGIGKSMGLSAFAVEFAKRKKDIIVFSLEMSEFEWMKRIYCNILDIPIMDLENIPPDIIKEKFESIKPYIGNIIVKEYPSYTLNSLQILNYLEKLEQKMGIKNPVVFVDYLGLMNSSRMQAGVNSYEYIKSITAELRSVAQRRNITIFSASQLNRSAVGNLEAGQESVSDSAGISMFADTMCFILQTKEMKQHGEVLVNFEKNRLTGATHSFKIGVDYSKMRFEDRFLTPEDENYSRPKPEPVIETGLSLGNTQLDDLLDDL